MNESDGEFIGEFCGLKYFFLEEYKTMVAWSFM